MKTKRNLLGTLACLLALLLLAGCAGAAPSSAPSEAPAPMPDAPDSEGASGAEDSFAPADESTEWALDIDTVTLDGTAVTSADFAGNTLTVLNVWGTWCPPCVGELPHLQAVSELFGDRGVEIVGVLQDGVTEPGVPDEGIIESANALLDDAGASYRVILPNETLMTEFISQMQYFPTTFFLDSSGNVVETVIGSKDTEGWEAIINGVLEKVG